MAVKLLVKIAVMMMAATAFRRHWKRRGEGAPSSSSYLTSSLDGRRVSPLVLGLHGMGGARAPPRLDLSLCFSLVLRSVLALFHRFMYIWRFVTPIGLKPSPWFFFRILAFLRKKKSINRLTSGPWGSEARLGGRRALLPRGHLGHRLAWIFLLEFSKYSKNKLRPFLSRLDSVWYGYSAKHKTCNKQKLALGTGSIC